MYIKKNIYKSHTKYSIEEKEKIYLYRRFEHENNLWK